MRTDYVHIAVVLDRSGSMDSRRDDTIGGFNHFLSEQKRQDGHATLTLVQFDHEYRVVNGFEPLVSVPALNRDTYLPRGSTALLNAIGRTIRDTGQRLAQMPDADRPAKVLFVIITDGHENASHEERNQTLRFTKAQINEMIGHQRSKYSWEFVFLGADQDAIEEGASMGISSSSTMSYVPNSVGTQFMFNSVTAGTSRLRCASAQGQNATFAFTEDDRAAQSEAEKSASS